MHFVWQRALHKRTKSNEASKAELTRQHLTTIMMARRTMTTITAIKARKIAAGTAVKKSLPATSQLNQEVVQLSCIETPPRSRKQIGKINWMGRRVGEPLALWTRYPRSSRIADIVEKNSATHGTTTTVVHTAQIGETIGPLEQAVA